MSPCLEPGDSVVYLQCQDPECPAHREGFEHAHAEGSDMISPDSAEDAPRAGYEQPARPLQGLKFENLCFTNTGHGHVNPRPDGLKNRCGGPKMCERCSKDQQYKDAMIAWQTPADNTPLTADCGPHCGTDHGTTRHCGLCHVGWPLGEGGHE